MAVAVATARAAAPNPFGGASSSVASNNPADLLKNAEKGDVNAQFQLGLQYALGRDGLEKNPAQSRRWYQKAADQGHTEAQYTVGLDYLYGQKGKPDMALAVKYLKMAADKNRPGAAGALASAQQRLATGK